MHDRPPPRGPRRDLTVEPVARRPREITTAVFDRLRVDRREVELLLRRAA